MRPVILLSALILLSCDAPSGPQGFIVQPADSGIGADSLGKDSAVKVDAVADAAPEVDAKPGADAGETGGTRLKPYYATAEDGTRERLAWLDADTGIRCTFQLAPDGFFRCLPWIHEERVLEGITHDTTWQVGTFTEPDCTGRVAVVPGGFSGCTPALVHYSIGPKSAAGDHALCGKPGAGVATFATVGALADVKEGATLYWWSAHAEPKCIEAPAPASGTYYHVGEDVPLSAFALAALGD